MVIAYAADFVQCADGDLPGFADTSLQADSQVRLPKNKAKRCVISEFYPQQRDTACLEHSDSVEVPVGFAPVAVTLYF